MCLVASQQYAISDDDDTGDADHTYALTSSELASVFEVDPSTGYIRRNTRSLDYETQNQYDLQLSVRDGGGLLAVTTVTVWIVDVNEPRYSLGTDIFKLLKQLQLELLSGILSCMIPTVTF